MGLTDKAVEWSLESTLAVNEGLVLNIDPTNVADGNWTGLTKHGDVKYDATWTNCTGPTTVIAPDYAEKDSTITVSWSGAKAGTNNAINGYWLYANGVSQGYTTATSKTYTIPGTGTYKFTVKEED